MKKLLWLWRGFVLTGLFGLIGLIVLWNGWFTPIQSIPRSIEILTLVAPLLWLVRGLLYARNSSHVYAILIALPYATLGVWYLFSDVEYLYGLGLLIFSSFIYIGGFFSVKVTSPDKSMQNRPSER